MRGLMGERFLKQFARGVLSRLEVTPTDEGETGSNGDGNVTSQPDGLESEKAPPEQQSGNPDEYLERTNPHSFPEYPVSTDRHIGVQGNTTMSDQPRHGTLHHVDSWLPLLQRAQAVYFALSNVDGTNDARLLYNGLMAVQGVVRAEILCAQGIATVIYDPELVTAAELCQAVEHIGIKSSRYFGAEIIGQSSGIDVLR